MGHQGRDQGGSGDLPRFRVQLPGPVYLGPGCGAALCHHEGYRRGAQGALDHDVDVGVLFDLAIHDVDILCYLSNKDVKSVYVSGGHLKIRIMKTMLVYLWNLKMKVLAFVKQIG